MTLTDDTTDAHRAGRYDRNFYLDQVEISQRSARRVVPILLDAFAPRSVVDVGCGVGTWLRAFEEGGVADVAGFDGSSSASGLLQIDADRVTTHDLTAPIRIGRTVDLAMSLEVAEHLPSSAADGFVDNLVELAPVVVFSAAIPGQGGTGHVNEQWPSWWAERFARHGYLPYDLVRRQVWDDADVATYYAQNLLVYVTDETAAATPALAGVEPATLLDVVHPRLFERKLAHPVLGAVAAKLPEHTKNAITRRLRNTSFFERP